MIKTILSKIAMDRMDTFCFPLIKENFPLGKGQMGSIPSSHIDIF